MDFQTIVLDPVNAMVLKLAAFIPNIIGALIILLLGWLVAKILELVVINLLKWVRFEVAAERAGIESFLERGEIKRTATELAGDIVYWLLMLITFVVAINALGLTAASDLLNKVLLYVPRVIAAIFVMVLGMFLAGFLQAVVMAAAHNARLSYANFIAKATYYAVIVFVLVTALDQLGLETQIIVSSFNVIVGAFALAFAIAFGLGCKDIAADFLKELVKKK